jgi:UDP-N-acetylmuramoyl-tripeptide--D-alanyl-D-alanine ligase
MMQLSAASLAMHGSLIGDDSAFDCVGTDSRAVRPGQLFVALKGEHFDGHDYAEQALEQGAAGVVLEKNTANLSPAIVVEDSYLALGQLAAHWRAKFAIPVVAITGSNGKTTVKEMLSAILAVKAGGMASIHATVGNLNNHIGLPLTMLKLRDSHQFTVLEMGMNHLGEIAYLSDLAKPTLALINNAGTAHLGELGSRDKIAQAKGEVFAGLAANGVALINADDDYAAYWRALNAGKKILSFGLDQAADVQASYQEKDGGYAVRLRTPAGEVAFTLPVMGIHNVRNALAASAAAYALGVSNADIATGLAGFSAVKGRLQNKMAIHGARLIDDTYNANPDSMKAAIDVLANQTGEKILVLGDMGELGTDAARMHREVGEYAKAKGLKQLYCLGELSLEMVQGFGVGARHFDDAAALAEVIKPQLSAQVTVLVKGSRFMKMERVVDLLDEKNNQTSLLENQSCY